MIIERNLSIFFSPEPAETNEAISLLIKENENKAASPLYKVSNFYSELEEDQQALKIPNFLPVTSCFEPDDVTLNEANNYQTLLEDITSFDLYEDYETIYSFPLKNLARLKQNYDNDSSNKKFTPFYNQEWWLRECEEILSPYSLKKEYLRLVQDFEICY